VPAGLLLPRSGSPGSPQGDAGHVPSPEVRL
jgi:hypothetical protein